MLKMQANEISNVNLIEGGNVIPLRSTTRTAVSPQVQPLATAVVNELGSVEFEFTPDIQTRLARITALMQVRDAALTEIRKLGESRLEFERENVRKTKGLKKSTQRHVAQITKLFGITLGLTLGLTYLIPNLMPNCYTLVKQAAVAEATIMQHQVDENVVFYKLLVKDVVFAKR